MKNNNAILRLGLAVAAFACFPVPGHSVSAPTPSAAGQRRTEVSGGAVSYSSEDDRGSVVRVIADPSVQTELNLTGDQQQQIRDILRQINQTKRELIGQTEPFKQRMKHRNAIEGTQSELVRAHGLRRARYRGLPKTKLQNYFIGAACNTKRWFRCAAWELKNGLTAILSPVTAS